MHFIFLLEIPAYIFHYLTIKRLTPVRKAPFSRFVLFFISGLLVSMIIYVGDRDNLPPTFLVYLLGFQYACAGSFAKKLTLSFMLSSTLLAYNTLLDSILFSIDFLPVVILRVAFSALLYLLIRFRGPDTETELGDSLWLLMLFLALPPLGIVLCIVLISPQVDRPAWLMSLYGSLLSFSVFSFLSLLWAITVLAKQRKLEKQNFYAEMNQNYYEAMHRQHFEVRRLKHDLSNHLHTVSLLPDAEKGSYITGLLQSPAFTQRTDYCGDMTVNAVLSIKDSLLRENDISLSLKLDIPKELPFEKSDVCVLFANALDNALESCLKFPKEKRFVELTARFRKGILALSLKNPTALTFYYPAEKGKTLSENFPASTKSDKKRHGYGLRSIETIVHHYSGSLEINADGDVFELFLYLPETGYFTAN